MKGRKREPVTRLAAWIGRRIEVRTDGGGAYRGRPLGVLNGFLHLERIGGVRR